MPVIDSPLGRELAHQGRSRAWLARKLGVKPWTFSRIEAGVQPAPADWYARAALILGVSVEVVAPEDEVAA